MPPQLFTYHTTITGHEHLYDLGELYLEMEDEGEKGIKGTMTEYIPVSHDAHRKRTEYLLSLLPGKAEQTLTTKDSETDLICYPNPTTGLLSLYFSLDSDSDVEISVYDMLGKVFKRIHKPF